MKFKFFTFLLIAAVAFSSCRKDKIEQNIKQYDQAQIEAYIAANGLTGMKRDTSGGDTTGIYYQIISQGTGDKIDYSTEASLVYSIKSFDGKYTLQDTFQNHAFNYVGHLAPNGFVLAIRNILKTQGTRARVLIPSHLAYGVSGAGSGSSTNASGRIAGNQCLDYYINVVAVKNDNSESANRNFTAAQSNYDDISIKNYMAANNLTGYTKSTSGLYYKITTQGTGNSITDISTVTCTYPNQLFDGTTFAPTGATTGYTFSVDGLVPGAKEGLELIKSGGSISLIIPSRLGYGIPGNTGIPVNSCLRFDFSVSSVTP